MLNTLSKYIFFYLLGLRTWGIITAPNWFTCWIILEVNLVRFIVVIFNNNILYLKNAPITYFIVQAISSALFLLVFIILVYYHKFIYHYTFLTHNLLLRIPLLIKVGRSPFHFWLPLVIKNIRWITNYLLITWQKLGPLSILYGFIHSSHIPFIIISTLVGAIYGLNQSSLKLIIAFSSINQIGWILYALILSKILFIIYIAIYSVILFNVILFFHLFKLDYLNQLTNLYLNKYTKITIAFNILSLGGIPPFLGFFPKLLIVIAFNNHPLIVYIIIISLITLFFYLRILIIASIYITIKINLLKTDTINSYFLIFTSWLTKISFILLILI